MTGLDLPGSRATAMNSKSTHSKKGREKVLENTAQKTDGVETYLQGKRNVKCQECSIMVTCLDMDLN